MTADRLPFVAPELAFIPVRECDVIRTSGGSGSNPDDGYIDFSPLPIPRP
ncbi:MAG: hypothetical protein IKN53_04850 [Oscillibacter sp.]|nr:hypothetical protein [Oscillibacter sp.]